LMRPACHHDPHANSLLNRGIARGLANVNACQITQLAPRTKPNTHGVETATSRPFSGQ